MDTSMCDYTVRLKTLSSAINFYNSGFREILQLLNIFFYVTTPIPSFERLQCSKRASNNAPEQKKLNLAGFSNSSAPQPHKRDIFNRMNDSTRPESKRTPNNSDGKTMTIK